MSIGYDACRIKPNHTVNNSVMSVRSHANTGYVNDHTITGAVGCSFTISQTLLGHGSYGSVYLATDENGTSVAVKCCDIDKHGIPNVLEASIMSSIRHPNLNRALRVTASAEKLYIIQELARTDLSNYTRRNKDNYKPGIDELKKWCHALALAVRTLHRENIIHADIKASNVLLYADESIRLTDFTLSVKKWTSTDIFKHNVCTCTHRPLECLLRQGWDESLDIWSLGCTFYEIAYGEYLFPYQGAIEPDTEAKDNLFKQRLRQRSANAIIDWAHRGPIPCTLSNIKMFDIDYIRFKFAEDYQRPEMRIFNDLVCHMLSVDANTRYNIDAVLSHAFFTGLTIPTYLTIQRPVRKLPLTEHARVTRFIQTYVDDPTIQSLALNIYARCQDLHDVAEKTRAGVCTWIASKIVNGLPVELPLSNDSILSIERDICHNLMFRLH